jgi:CRISPR/Cas system CMR-associated protein Cmr5 small subunit
VKTETQSVEQKRALAALDFWKKNDPAKARGDDEGDVVSGLPALLITNGLFALCSFAVAKKGGHARLMADVTRFLVAEGRLRPRLAVPSSGDDVAQIKAFLEALAKVDSSILRQATAEALAYLGYLKRFAPPKPKKGKDAKETSL